MAIGGHRQVVGRIYSNGVTRLIHTSCYRGRIERLDTAEKMDTLSNATLSRSFRRCHSARHMLIAFSIASRRDSGKSLE